MLNGKSMKLKGGCVHHDNGLLGAAAIDRAEERKVELMKANGYNAVRCAHNQVSEYFLDACDRLGMLVIHETFDQWQKAKREQDYHQFFDEWSDWDLAASVRRDRNHPSIIMWSIGNEVEQRADEPEGDLISKRLVNTVRKYDTSRFTTIGSNDFWDRRQFSWDKDSYRIFKNLDVAGYNYIWWKYESDHAAYPDRDDPVGIFVPTKLASVPEVIGTDGCETGCIVLADGIHQSFGNQVSLRFISTLLHLVTDTPHNDRGMIPVTADRRSQIPVAPFIKELMIVLLAFSFLPLVEGFMNHQHTQSVASIKEILGHLIVGTSDGIVAVSFHQFHFPFFGTVDGGGSQKSVIVMYATPPLARLFIDLPIHSRKPFLSRKRKGAASWT